MISSFIRSCGEVVGGLIVCGLIGALVGVLMAFPMVLPVIGLAGLYLELRPRHDDGGRDE